MAARRRALLGELVRRGLADDEPGARALLDAGRVTVGGAPTTNAHRQVAAGEPVVVLAPPARFASRAGDKLDAALHRFGIDVAGRRAVDVGASTGGFTDCLLQRGASEVVALDVGHGHLLDRLRHDPRVVVVERCNVRRLADAAGGAEERARLVGPPAPLVTVDVSFVSLAAVADALLDLVAPGGDLVALVKPQFEADRRTVSRGGGVVGDPEVWADALRVAMSALEERGAVIMGAMSSPVRGASGNVELLVHARRPAPGGPPPMPWSGEVAEVVAEAVAAGPDPEAGT